MINSGISKKSLEFDLDILEDYLKRENTVSILALFCGGNLTLFLASLVHHSFCYGGCFMLVPLDLGT